MKVDQFLSTTGLQPTGNVTFQQLRAILEDEAPSAQPSTAAPGAPSSAHVATPSPATPAPGSTPPGGIASAPPA